MPRTEIWSCGGGVQSSAIAALIIRGELPKPDLAVIVDTERELSTTWDYLNQHTGPALAEVGVTVHRVKKSDFATVDLYRNDDILIPAFTTESGDVGKLPTFCSNEWKQRVMRRWATAQGVTAANIWIGISIDEKRRIKTPIGKWEHRYPLIEKKISRGDCIAIVERMGWPTPPRSSCWMCPNHTRADWEWQKENAPDDHQKAVNFEIAMNRIDQDLWLTETGEPIDKADFKKDDLFQGRCDSGMCFT